MTLILASASRSRQVLLRNTGLVFEVVPADIDEAAVRQAILREDGSVEPADLAELLARAKADDVAERHPGAIVIGADQTLALADRIFEKPADIDAARGHLLALRGKTHQLHAAAVVAAPGGEVWSHIDTAHMTMRALSPEFIDRYLAEAGGQVCQSVGAYQLESLGIQLFERIEGDYFTILGLPMLPLIGHLRSLGALPA